MNNFVTAKVNVKFMNEGCNRVINQAIEYRNQVAENIRQDASDTAPVATGKLRDSMVVYNSKEQSEIVAEVPYSLYVESGTRHMAGRFFLTRALFNVKNYFI